MANFDFALVRPVLLTPKKGEAPKLDINGNQTVLLDSVAGKIPSNRSMSGTIAEKEGFVVGKTYFVGIEQLASNEYGEQFRFKNLGEMSPGREFIATCKDLGAGIVIKSTTVQNDIVIENKAPVLA